MPWTMDLKRKQSRLPLPKHMGHVAALVRSHMNGLKPFGRTIEQTTETMSPSPKAITAAAITTNRLNKKLTKAATLPKNIVITQLNPWKDKHNLFFLSALADRVVT